MSTEMVPKEGHVPPSAFELNPEFILGLMDRLKSNHQRRLTESRTFPFLPGFGEWPRERPVNDLPSAAQLADLIRTVFWASLAREEGETHPFSVWFGSFPTEPGFVEKGYQFATRLPFSVAVLAKLAPALRPLMDRIVVSTNKNLSLSVTGISDFVQADLELSCPNPGHVFIRFDTMPIAYITGSAAVYVDASKIDWNSTSAAPVVSASAPGSLQITTWRLVLDIAREMLALGHGGALLLTNEPTWKRSVVEPITYGLGQGNASQTPNILHYDESFGPVTESIFDARWNNGIDPFNVLKHKLAKLTAVDGATLATLSFPLTCLAFGAKLTPVNTEVRPREILVWEPIEGYEPSLTPLTALGGTRHQSAAQFVFDQKKSLAVVVSQDRFASFMTWDAEIERVVMLRHAEMALGQFL